MSERVRLIRGFFFPGSNQRKMLFMSCFVILSLAGSYIAIALAS